MDLLSETDMAGDVLTLGMESSCVMGLVVFAGLGWCDGLGVAACCAHGTRILSLTALC